jgi:replicative DNA helicase
MNMHPRRNTFSPDMGEAVRELPANLEAEQALLGAILMNNAALNAISPTGIGHQHFRELFHRAVFEAIKECVKAGKVANPVTLRSFLPPDVLAKPIGDMTAAQYIAVLAGSAVTVINAPDYAQAVISYAMRRDGICAAQIAEQAAWSTEDDLSLADGIRNARDRLTNILTVLEGNDDNRTSFADEVDDTLDKTDDAARGREPSGLDPGIPEIVALTGLWEPGHLIVIGGDVKTGKSALAWQTFFNIAERHPVAGFSGEMPRAQIIRREKARRTGISDKRQRRGQVSSIDMDELVRAGADMKRLKFIDIDCRRLTLEQIDARIERLVGEHGIQAYYVDHLLKLAWTGKMEDMDDHKKASRATSMLKDMAMKHKIPIIALTHVNKSWTGGSYGKSFSDNLRVAQFRRPTFKDMLGNIDKDADNMIIVHQTLPAITALEPEQGTADHAAWQAAMADAEGRAQIILALSRENEFPRRKDVEWHGETTSYGPPFKQAFNERERLL